MKKLQTIYEQGDHKWDIVARDPEKPDYIIDTNEYLIQSGDESLLADPGGMEIFPAVFSAISDATNPACIKHLFASHQDPDIISSLALWMEFNPDITCHVSWLWSGFIPHFGGNDKTFKNIPDEGHTIKVGKLNLFAMPAHYLHSSGNFHLYDGKAKILFTGDVGAALLPENMNELFVKDFSQHIKYAADFHRRWMGSNDAKNDWCDRVSDMDIDILCPQHGAIYQGEDVQRFINWFAELDVGIKTFDNGKKEKAA